MLFLYICHDIPMLSYVYKNNINNGYEDISLRKARTRTTSGGSQLLCFAVQALGFAPKAIDVHRQMGPASVEEQAGHLGNVA